MVKQIQIPEIGDELRNGAKVISFKSNGTKHIVLAKYDRGAHPFVTWRLDDDGNTFLGHYFSKLKAAEIDFMER